MTNNLYDEEDLLELSRAIKFAHPDYDVQSVHQEITEKLSKKETFEFLSSVKIEHVESVWEMVLASKKSSVENKMDDSVASADDKVLRFYSVGDGSVKRLAGTYSLKAATEAKRRSDPNDVLEGVRYVHCFLDVPADLSGTKPYQALINFNNISDDDEGDRNVTNLDIEIVKIQTATEIPGYGPTPMLLYNKDRSYKTFIHPCAGPNEDYNLIRQQIEAYGTGGMLSGGGKKGYFYARVSQSDGKRIISVDVSTGMAPIQQW